MSGMTLAHAEDAWLEGDAEWREFQRTVDAEWFGPLVKTMVVMNWDEIQRMPAAVREQLRKMDPEAYGRFEALAKRLVSGQEVPSA